jgi:hypothetical protein
MSANDIEDVIDTGIPLPRISNVRAAAPATLIVTWAEGRRAGQVDRIDIAPIINTYKIFRPLRKNQKLFKTAHLTDDGDVVTWAGDDLELSAEAIESVAEQIMTPTEFVAFMKRNKLTEEAIASILDYSRRQIGYFKTTGPIPRVVALACKGYETYRVEGNWHSRDEGTWKQLKAQLKEKWRNRTHDLDRVAGQRKQLESIIDKQIDHQQATLLEAVAAQQKAWRDAAERFHMAAAELAADRRTDIDAALRRMKADASEAEAKLQKLMRRETESWETLTSVLAESRATFDRDNQFAWDAFKRAGRP